MTKPPIGIIPRWLHEEINFDDTSSQSRIDHINEGIERYRSVNKAVPEAWLLEKKDIENIMSANFA